MCGSVVFAVSGKVVYVQAPQHLIGLLHQMVDVKDLLLQNGGLCFELFQPVFQEEYLLYDSVHF